MTPFGTRCSHVVDTLDELNHQMAYIVLYTNDMGVLKVLKIVILLLILAFTESFPNSQSNIVIIVFKITLVQSKPAKPVLLH
jgi:hypothetical protein